MTRAHTIPTDFKPELQEYNHYCARLSELEKSCDYVTKLKTAFPNTTQFNVLSIGCGESIPECMALSQRFHEENPSLAINYIGIDVDARSIKKLKKQYQNLSHIEFHQLNGTDLEGLLKILDDRKIHIVVFRHPLVFTDFKMTTVYAYQFEVIFLKTLPTVLEKNGLLIGSCFHQEELTAFKQLVNLISTRNTELTILDSSTKLLLDTEVMPSHLGDTHRKMYADQFFLAYSNFQANHAATVAWFEKPTADVNMLVEIFKSILLNSGSTLTTNLAYRAICCAIEQFKIFEKLPTNSEVAAQIALALLDEKAIKPSLDCKQLEKATWMLARYANCEEYFTQLLQRIVGILLRTAQYLMSEFPTLAKETIPYIESLLWVLNFPLPYRLEEQSSTASSTASDPHWINESRSTKANIFA